MVKNGYYSYYFAARETVCHMHKSGSTHAMSFISPVS